MFWLGLAWLGLAWLGLCLALPCLALPCLALPCLALPCLALSCLVLSCPVRSCLVSSRRVSSRLVSSRFLSDILLPCASKDVELFTGPTRLVLQAVQDTGGRYGFAVPISLLLGTTNAKNRVYNATSKPSFGKGKERGKNESFWKALFHQLVEIEGLLQAVSFSSDSGGRGGVTYRLTDEGRTFLRNDKAKLPLSFTPSDELRVEGKRLKTAVSTPATQPQSQAMRDGLSDDEQKVHALVHKLRSDIAAAQGIPPYNVLGGQVLKELAKRRPVDLPTLATVDGMSEKKVLDYGADIIEVLVSACKELKLEGNMPPVLVEQPAWLTTARDKSLTSTQQRSLEEYNRKGSMTLEQVAASLSRPISASAFAGHMAACLEGGLSFAWDRRRLCIDQTLESKIMSILDHFKKEGLDPLAAGFRLKPIYEELPPDTDKSVYNTIRLILARMRFESKGGRLPGSSGPIAASPTSKTPSGKKRALPTWGGGGTGGGGGGGGGGSASGRPKRETPPWNATPSPTGSSLFTPSYTAKPSPGNQSGAASPPAAAFTATAAARPTSKASEPWTSSMVLGAIKKAGPSGITLQAMVAANAGKDEGLESLLGSLQEDFAIFTKPGESSGGRPVYLAL